MGRRLPRRVSTFRPLKHLMLTSTISNSWCDPFKTWQKSYSFDPVANLTSTEAQLVLGGTPTPSLSS